MGQGPSVVKGEPPEAVYGSKPFNGFKIPGLGAIALTCSAVMDAGWTKEESHSLPLDDPD
ncbi:hypothetical protein [Laspinema olomoucense]|uniref:Uncharacterized protein n=1 Tax=Laspinema olomoucense D3b TaxID=2953688 RepID=A0ABT2NDB4_9CYAN|nr:MULTISPECIES: hypothetical protein [unclassified Laspinema]MCT7979874.1 hypothetical protein [Laspinema sp. D3b]MCT7987387.1 hypothetical protein [Laspinema sp. D3a]